jgi:hypothetical protein
MRTERIVSEDRGGTESSPSQRVLERGKAQAKHLKESFVHWCAEANRLSQGENTEEKNQLLEELREPLTNLDDVLQGKITKAEFEKRFPTTTIIGGMADRLFAHAKDPNWFTEKDIKEIKEAVAAARAQFE